MILRSSFKRRPQSHEQEDRLIDRPELLLLQWVLTVISRQQKGGGRAAPHHSCGAADQFSDVLLSRGRVAALSPSPWRCSSVAQGLTYILRGVVEMMPVTYCLIFCALITIMY